MRFIHAAAAGLIAVSLIATGAQAGKGGGATDKASFFDCKAPAPAAILSKMLDQWPVEKFRKLAKSQTAGVPPMLSDNDAMMLAQTIESYGYYEQQQIIAVNHAMHPSKKADPLPQPRPIMAAEFDLDGYRWNDTNNLGLMYHQFVDGLLENAIDKVGYIKWRDASLGQASITHRGLSLLHEWADPSAAGTIAKCTSLDEAPTSALPVAERPGMRVAAVTSAVPPAGKPASKDWTPASAPGWFARQNPAFMQSRDLLPDFYMRSSSAYLAQALTDKIVAGLKANDSSLPAPGASDTSASIAFHHDQLNQTSNTFTMHLALGFGFSPDRNDKNSDGEDGDAANSNPAADWGFLSYVTADRVNDADPKLLNKNLTDLGAGLAAVYAARPSSSGSFSGIEQFRISLRAQGDTDDQFGASILYVAGQFSAVPTFLPCVTHWFPSKDSLIRFVCNYNVDLDYGHIFNAGDFANLNQKEYARLGFDASATVSGPNNDDLDGSDLTDFQYLVMNFASRLSFSASYKALHDFSGNGAGLSRLETGLNFKLSSGDSGPSTSIGLSYINGRADVTLTRQRYWEFSLKASL